MRFISSLNPAVSSAIVFVMIVFLTPDVFAQAGAVGVGTTTPDNSAILEVSSTGKGVLIPRMVTAQRAAIPSPATGLMVYDNDTNSFWYFDGIQWVEVMAGVDNDQQDLSLTGHTLAITNDATSVDLSGYLDNTDNQTLTFSSPSLSISNGNTVDLSPLQDGTGTDNQTLTFSSPNLTISNGNSVNLSGLQDGTGTDNQNLGLSGTTLSITNGNSVDLEDIQHGGETVAGTVTAGNWYRIAQNGNGDPIASGNRASGLFTLRDFISGGGHSTLVFQLGIAFNYEAGMSFTMLSHNRYSSAATFSQVRVLENTTYSTQYVEVYCNRTGSVEFTISQNQQSSGWTPVAWTAGSIPSGYSARTYDVDKAFVVGSSDDLFTIERNGNVGIGTTSPTSHLYVNGRIRTNGINETSDQRLKKNIQTIENPLEKVAQLRGVNYEWRTDEFPDFKLESGVEIGLIAQEVETVIPEVVATDQDGYKSVEYAHLVALLIEATKELRATVEEQQMQINRLLENADRGNAAKNQDSSLK